MAMPAIKFEPEDPLYQRPTWKLDSLNDPLTTTLINIDKEFGMLRRAQAFDRVWLILMTCGMFAIMAREFNWI